MTRIMDSWVGEASSCRYERERIARSICKRPEQTWLLWGWEGREGSRLAKARALSQEQREEPGEENPHKEQAAAGWDREGI